MAGSPRARDHDRPVLAGRDREVARLEALVAEVAAGTGRLALIAGDAGIGKTALTETVLTYAGEMGALPLTGGCYDLTAIPPYGPWIEMARHYDLTRARRGGSLPDAPAALTGAAAPVEVRSLSDFFEQVTDFVLMLASRSPLIIVLEDLHWADDASLDLLRHVARRTAHAPVLIVGTYRGAGGSAAAGIELMAPLLTRENRVEVLRPRPLDRAALDALVAARYRLAGPDHQRLGDYLEAHAEGIPLFAVELLRGLEDDRILKLDGDAWKLGDLERLRIPPVLQAMTEARMKRLPDGLLNSLRLAAIGGQEVDLDFWGSVAGLNEDALIESAEHLEAERFVSVRSDGGTLRFQHALIHRAVYESISAPRRRSLHRQVAEALAATERHDPDRVAWHFEQAGDARQAEWLLRAAERAQRGYAWGAAAERMIAVDELAASDDARERGWRRYRIGRLRRHLDPADARQWLMEAERLGAAASDPVLVAFATFDQGHVRVLAGDYERGIELMLRGDKLLEALEPGDIRPEVAAWIADALPEDATVSPAGDWQITSAGTRRGTLVQWLSEAGRLDEAQELGEAFAVEPDLLAGYPDQWLSSQGDAWYGLGRVRSWCGQPDSARAALERALECYRRIDHHLLMAATQRVILEDVLIPFHTGRVRERERLRAAAEDSYRRATGVADESLIAGFASLEELVLNGAWHEAVGLLRDAVAGDRGIVLWRHRVAAMLARLEREGGNHEGANRLIARVLPAGPDTPPGSTTYLAAIDMLMVAVDLKLDAGDLDAAGHWLDVLDMWLAWSGAVRGRAEALLARARWLAAGGETVDAIELAGQALAVARSPHQPLAESAALRLHGELHARRGQYDAAREDLTLALASADACATAYDAALARLALADVESATGASARAREILEQVCADLEALGANRALTVSRERLARLGGQNAASPAPFGLSKREIEVLTHVAAGLTDAQVAEELSISYRTVTTHLTSIFTKLNVNSRVAATRIAVEQGIV